MGTQWTITCGIDITTAYFGDKLTFIQRTVRLTHYLSCKWHTNAFTNYINMSLNTIFGFSSHPSYSHGSCISQHDKQFSFVTIEFNSTWLNPIIYNHHIYISFHTSRKNSITPRHPDSACEITWKRCESILLELVIMYDLCPYINVCVHM